MAVNMTWSDPTGTQASNGLALVTGDTLTQDSWQRTVSNLYRLGGSDGNLVYPNDAVVNVRFTATVASNALTIALKGRDGNDPSATNPVRVLFRNATLTTGAPTVVTGTAAVSLVVPDTATLGMTNGVAYRLWVGLMHASDGTLILLIFNTQATTTVYPLPSEAALQTATAISTGSDSANTLYGNASDSNRPIRWIGYIEISEATAGTWATAPTVVHLFTPGTPWPGSTINEVHTTTGAVATGTTLIPYDDTIPQNTEGDQYMSQAIIPTSAINQLRITVKLNGAGFSTAGGYNSTVALFQDTTADALAATNNESANNNTVFNDVLIHQMRAGTTSSTTFKVRAGLGSNGGGETFTFNGRAGARKMGGVLESSITIEEIAV